MRNTTQCWNVFVLIQLFHCSVIYHINISKYFRLRYKYRKTFQFAAVLFIENSNLYNQRIICNLILCRKNDDVKAKVLLEPEKPSSNQRHTRLIISNVVQRKRKQVLILIFLFSWNIHKGIETSRPMIQSKFLGCFQDACYFDLQLN